MKKCCKCNIEKSLLEFSKNKTQLDGYQRYCKTCKKVEDKKWYDENPSVWKESNKKKNEKITLIIDNFRTILGGCCKKCNENRRHLLDFHHIDPSKKEAIIIDILAWYGYGDEGIKKGKEELIKCMLLCSNCHRDFHFLERTQKITIINYING